MFVNVFHKEAYIMCFFLFVSTLKFTFFCVAFSDPLTCVKELVSDGRSVCIVWPNFARPIVMLAITIDHQVNVVLCCRFLL